MAGAVAYRMVIRPAVWVSSRNSLSRPATSAAKAPPEHDGQGGVPAQRQQRQQAPHGPISRSATGDGPASQSRPAASGTATVDVIGKLSRGAAGLLWLAGLSHVD